MGVDVNASTPVKQPVDAKCDDEPSGTSADGINIGAWVEVFSNSHQAWCMGRVTKAEPNRVTIVFQLPGAAEDEWCEKRLHPKDKDLRRVNTVASCKDLRSVKPQPEGFIWSEMETSAFKDTLRGLLGNQDDQSEQLCVSDQVVAEYMRVSEL